jgi:tetratricopeptide (TPR) repeat protein
MKRRFPNGRARVLLAVLALSTAPLAAMAADDVDAGLLPIQHAWEQANYGTSSPEEKKSSLAALSEQVGMFVREHPGRAEPLVWQGIVLSSYAGAKGGLGALSLAKQARDSLLAAIELDPAALQGSAFTSLGALYYKVPGFPLGFGNRDKAADLLQKALAVNPQGIDPNFFYAEFLFETGEYAESMRYLQKAMAAPARPDRPLADSGRRREIDALMTRVKARQG